MISAETMARKRSNERPVTDEDRKLVRELTGAILDRMRELNLTRQQVGERAGRQSASTLYGWRNRTSERPSLLDLHDFAKAVGLKVALVPQDAPTPVNGVNGMGGVGGKPLKPETAYVVRVMEDEDASDELREAILAAILKMLTGRAAHPLDAATDQPGHRARSHK